MIIDRKARIRALEQQMERLPETDGVDLYTVLSMIADDQSEFMEDFIHTRLAWDIINASQSNPKASHAVLKRLVRMDNAISQYDDELTDPGLVDNKL